MADMFSTGLPQATPQNLQAGTAATSQLSAAGMQATAQNAQDSFAAGLLDTYVKKMQKVIESLKSSVF